jgi:transposase
LRVSIDFIENSNKGAVFDYIRQSIKLFIFHSLVAGLIDDLGIVQKINELVGEQPGEIVSPGQVVKAMIINGLGLVSAPLYLFYKFFEWKAIEHLLGSGIQASHLNDDRLGRVLDKL